MSEFAPLPLYMTLEEAAQAMTERTGRNWSTRQILGCAERHELQVLARIGHAVTYVREAPDKERCELSVPAGFLPPLGTDAIRALLLTDTATSTGWDEPGTLDIGGHLIPVWKPAYRLAPGHKAPAVTLSACRVSAAGVMQLVGAYTALSAPAAGANGLAAVEPAPAPKQETLKERGIRLLDWLEQEQRDSGERGALARVAKRERARRPTADRSNIAKEIKKARTERAAARRAGPFDGL